MQILDDDCCKGERCRTALLAASSSTSFTSGSQSPATAVDMQQGRAIRRPYIQCHDDNANRGHGAMDQFFGSSYHLQIDRHSINILLRAAAAFVLLCIAGCLALQHLRLSRLEHRIRRIELSSAYSVQVCCRIVEFFTFLYSFLHQRQLSESP